MPQIAIDTGELSIEEYFENIFLSALKKHEEQKAKPCIFADFPDKVTATDIIKMYKLVKKPKSYKTIMTMSSDGRLKRYHKGNIPYYLKSEVIQVIRG